jgi:hypothetical protein
MLTGKSFRLEHATLAVGLIDGRRRAVTIPTGAIIQIVSGPQDGNGMVNVRWDERTVEMFEIDVNVRGTEIIDQSSRRATQTPQSSGTQN